MAGTDTASGAATAEGAAPAATAEGAAGAATAEGAAGAATAEGAAGAATAEGAAGAATAEGAAGAATKPPSLYDRLGGEAGVRRLTRRLYALMDTLPEAAACRAIHPASLAESEQKLFEYLSFWLGGPPLFLERRGPPMLRARHLHAPIAGPEIEGWLLCFSLAWAEQVDDPEMTRAVMRRVVPLAQHMRNRPDADAAPGGPAHEAWTPP